MATNIKFEFTDMDDINGERSSIWSVLLYQMHISPYYTSEQSVSGTLEYILNKYAGNIDFPNTVFDSLLDSLREDYQEYNWRDNPNAFWNETWNDALSSFLKSISPADSRNYEDSLEIYIKGDGTLVNPKYINGGIAVHNGIALRYKDVQKADAGANFLTEDALGLPAKFYENGNIKVKIREQTFDIGADFFINDGASITLENIKIVKFYNAKVYDECIKYIEENPTFLVKIEIEGDSERCYLLTNPWVIPWYNINGFSYSAVRGNDKKVSVLSNSNRLSFTQSTNAHSSEGGVRLLMPQNRRNVEVEDLNRNFWVIAQVISALSIYLFDEDGPLPKSFKDMIGAIADIWENVEYLWAAIAALGQNPRVTDVMGMIIPLTNTDIQPYLKFDDFDNLTTSNYRNICEDRLAYLKDSYRDCHLAIIPEIRLENYEKNYYAKVVYPGILLLDRNDTSGFYWQDIGSSQMYTIDLTDETHKDITYALREIDEGNYAYFAPADAEITEGAARRYYQLLRPVYSNFEPEYTEDIEDDEVVGWSIKASVNIEYIDVARKLATGETKVVWKDGTWTSDTVTATSLSTLPIEEGYYQGELLSYYQMTKGLAYLVQVEYVELEPLGLTGEQAEIRIESKIDSANGALQCYFEDYFQYQSDYDENKLYILFGHFYYNGYTREEGDAGLAYWTDEGYVSSEDSTYKAGNEGIDTGMIIYLPGQHDTPIVLGGPGGYWAYSHYHTADGYFASSTGNSSYRIELYTKSGFITDSDSWYMKFINTVALDSEDPPVVGKDSDHSFHHSSYTNGHYFANRRIFVYYISTDSEGHGYIQERKKERSDLNNNFVSTINGSFYINSPESYTCEIQKGVHIQGTGTKIQLLNIKTNYSDTKYPDYENCPNNGYTM